MYTAGNMDSITDFPKGSLWRRWDLHVHTPLSLENSYGRSRNTDAWELFLQDLELLPPEYAVLGINDYLFIDGYKKLKEEKEVNGRLAKIKMILPVIEFRLKKFAGTDGDLEKINFHVIFSPEVDPEIIQQHFLNALPRHYNLTPKHEALKNEWNALATRESLEELGRKIKATVPESELGNYGSDLKEGFNNINFDEEKIFEVLESHYFKGKYFTAVGKTEWANIRWNNQSIADKKDAINKVDFVFISSENPEGYERSRQALKDSGVNSLLLDCSDAHHYSTSHDKDRIGKCFTWIKADPTFEGLRQLIYEPESRLKIDINKPEEKKPYQVIDNVQFIDNTGRNLFSNNQIETNPNLTTIIGGKSTGKSLLAYFIARTIDPKEVGKRFDNELPPYEGLVDDFNFDFKVNWSDGVSSSLKGENNERKLLYIPQNYLSSLSEKTSQSREALNEFIFDIITQDESIKAKYSEVKREIEENINGTKEDLGSYFLLKGEAEGKLLQITKIGDKDGIKKYVDQLKDKVDSLKKESGLTPAEMGELKGLLSKRKGVEQKLLILGKDEESANALFVELDSLSKSIGNVVDKRLSYIVSPDIKSIIIERTKWVEGLKKHIKATSRQILLQVDKDRALQNKTLKEINDKMKPLVNKFKLQKELSGLIEQIKLEEEKLHKISLIEKSAETDEQKLDDILKGILIKNKDVFEKYQYLQNEMKKGESGLGGINLSVGIEFQEERFNDEFVNAFVNKHDLKRVLGVKGDEEFYYKFDSKFHLDIMKKMVQGVLSGEIGVLKYKTNQEAIAKMFGDYFSLLFSISSEGDSLDMMSPGKRALTLLKLLISLSEEECPVLIDQPESDLDNRSIYYDLVKFIKDRKGKRQIIVVTHNPNLVVGADAEEVVVANQKGVSTDKQNRLYQFEYVSGSLENSVGKDTSETAILYSMGIKEHVCEILEGGTEAFRKREKRYNIQ